MAAKSLPRRNLVDRFEEKVDRSAGPDACHPWLATTNQKGYGRVHVFGEGLHSSHRVAYEMAVGPIPDGSMVLHRCDNPSCCNPRHLFLGSHTDNMRDRNRKERQSRGESRPGAKLTAEDVRKIRAMHGKISKREIAALFGVGPTSVGSVLNRKTWRHVK